MHPESLIGKTIAGKYEIQSVIGRGGLGVVFKAMQKHLDRPCALKVMFSDLTGDQTGFERFEREAKLASSLASDNIVSVIDFGIADEGMAYLVMEYINGESLEQVVSREGRLEPSRAIPLFMCILNALHFAHEKGAIHRDLKPSNVMVARDHSGQDNVKLVDFGMAKYFRDDASESQNLTTMGRIQGSPAYMSPEQCLGRKMDARTDIYSLGCIMYRVLVGALPYSASSAFEAMNMHVSMPPIGISTAAPDLVLPAGLEACLMKCLAKKIEDRYANVTDLRADLEMALMACWSAYSSSGITQTVQSAALTTPFDSTDPESLKTAASLGNTGAQYQLALVYREGELLPKNDLESMNLLMKAAESGNAQAQYELAVCYDFGDYMAMDPVQACQWYKKAAEQGVTGAMVNLACILEGDRGVDTNYPEMLYWYRRAAENGHSLGQSNYGRCLYYGIGTEKKLPEAVRWMTAAIETDDTNDGALYLLGICYYFGDGVNQDRAKAVELYQAAALLDHGGAACELGLCYIDGDGVERNVEEGMNWLRVAADFGSTAALDKLGKIESASVMDDVERNQVESWFATTRGVSLQPAEVKLRSLLKEPLDKPLREVISTLKLLADRGHEFATIILAKCYERGIGISKSLDKAAELYLSAFERGSEIVEPHLTECFRLCFESAIFPTDSLTWLQKAADRRNVPAMLAIAGFWRANNPRGRDLTEALRWYRKAAELGDREAQYSLARFLTMKNLNKRERLRVVRWWADDIDSDLDPTSITDFDEDGFSTERQEALKWLHKAAEDASPEALRFLSALRNRGMMLEPSSEEAIKLLERAADLDDPEAQGLLGVAMLEGESVLRNPAKGIALVEQGARMLDPFSLWNLALELIEGKNVSANRPLAKQLLEKSAEAGFTQDKFWSESGFQSRFSRLAALFEDLAKRGQKEARYWLGLCCELGIGLKKDRDRSVWLYLQAAEQGYEPARIAFEKAPANLKSWAHKKQLEIDFDRANKQIADTQGITQ
ncbi:MAG: protein kinase [Candidatus Melainabacteria bacterium]|nr:protein kinase [Candidatus Melainabacteria bacterium]